jgi:hypothetical protein
MAPTLPRSVELQSFPWQCAVLYAAYKAVALLFAFPDLGNHATRAG